MDGVEKSTMTQSSMHDDTDSEDDDSCQANDSSDEVWNSFKTALYKIVQV